MLRLLTLMILLITAILHAEPTPPLMPVITETPLPPPVTLPGPEATNDTPAEPLTATEAARLALRRQPSLTVAQMNVAAAQGRLRQARADLYPSVTLTTGYSDPLVSSSSNAASEFSAGANVRQLLFDDQRARSLARQAGAQEESARAGFTRARADLVLQVKQAFYAYAQQQRQVAVQEANLRNRREHLALAKARVQAGVGLPIDVVRAETAVAEAVLGLNLAQTNAAVARVSLAQLIGLDPRTPLDIVEDAEPAPATDDFTALQAQALARRPEVSQTQAALRAADYALRAARAADAPSVVGTIGMGLRGPSFPPSNETLTLGVALEWDAFDGGDIAGRLEEARAQHTAAQAQVAAVTLAVTASVSQAYLNAKTAEQRVITADAQVANAGEGVRLAEGRYNAGLGTFLDVLDTQATLVTALTNRINARSAVNQARAALAHAIHADPALAPVTP